MTFCIVGSSQCLGYGRLIASRFSYPLATYGRLHSSFTIMKLFYVTLLLVVSNYAHCQNIHLDEGGPIIRNNEEKYYQKGSNVYSRSQLVDLGYDYNVIDSGVRIGTLKAIPNFKMAMAEGEWMFSCETTAHDYWYVNTHALSKEYGNVKLWLKTITPTATIKGKKYKNTVDKILMIIDCIGRRYKILQTTTYYLGEVIQENKDPDDFFQNVIPETALDDVSKTACKMFN